MIELIGLIIGGVGRLLPEVFGFFKAKQEGDHEYRMTELQLKVDQARAAQAIDLAHAQAEIAQQAGEMSAWAEALRSEGTRVSGIAWIDALNQSVRPVLTYWWCIALYTGAKTLSLMVAYQDHKTLAEFAPLVVTEFDQAVISTIIGFWFVDRAIKAMGRLK